MIFVTVGTQMPFDRLVRVVDQWAGLRNHGEVFAQIGSTDWKPEHISWVSYLEADVYQRKFEDADAVVAHAGMGTIIKALQMRKPLLIMPRMEHLGEHRNNHQMATAKRFESYESIEAAYSEAELMERLDKMKEMRAPQTIGAHASEELIDTLRRFIDDLE
ncbi:MAG: glycosyltransferase [Planctomycetota bacterium]|jgi:UDP-N-acetylglucosamine transferase subunit ALG13